MSKIYANPFSWGEPVKGSHYVQRANDQAFILDRIEAQFQILLTGQRGTGKTSLIKHILDKHPTSSLHFDLPFIVSRQGLIDLLTAGLINSFPKAEQDERLQAIREDPERSNLKILFDVWYDLVKASNKTFVIVWDEFQHLAKFKADIIGELKRALKGRRGIVHLFVSHRKDILQSAFGQGSQGFFKQQVIYELGNLEEKICLQYLSRRFRRMGLSDFDLPAAVYKVTRGQALFTQRLAYTVAQVWLEGTSTRLLQRSVAKLLKERNILFTYIWDQFGLNEKRLLIGLASGFSRPTELGFIAQFGLSATSTAHNTVIKLVREGWVVNRDEGYHIYDSLFLSWLQKNEGVS